MDGSYDVVTSALQNHARTLGELAGELTAALEAAGAGGMTGTAYGQTGQKFASAMDALARIGQDSLRTGAEALEAAGTTLRATADAYERGDAASAELLAGEAGGLTS